MKDWGVALKGDPSDLQVLTEQFRSSPLTVTKGRDSYDLRCDDFASMDDPNSVRDHGIELIKRLNGVAKLFHPALGPIGFGGSITRDYPDGRRDLFFFPPPFTGRSRVSAALTNAGDDPNAPLPATVSETRMALAASNEPVARAMRLFGYEHTWDNLYKVHEVMKEDVGAGEIKVHFPNGCRLETFTRTANARRAAGDGARHGHEKNEPPKNPMSLAEARDLIRGWLAHWLASK